MRDPIFVVGDRATGKTVKAIAEAESVNGLLVVANKMMIDFTKRLAQDHNIRIMQPITHADLLFRERLAGLRRVPLILDDAGTLFRNLISRYYPDVFHMMTWSVDVERFLYLEPRSLSVIDQLREYRKSLSSYGTVVPITQLWELEEENQKLRTALEHARMKEMNAIALLTKVMANHQGEEND